MRRYASAPSTVMRALCGLCAELGGNDLGARLAGSARARAGRRGERPQARRRMLRGRRGCGAAGAGVTYCIEPLARNQTAFINTVAGSRRYRARDRQSGAAHHDRLLGAPVQAEAEPVDALVAALAAERADRAYAFQRSEPARPGRRRACVRRRSSAALRDGGYDGDASIEPFVYMPDGPTCAARGIGYIRGIMETRPA